MSIIKENDYALFAHGSGKTFLKKIELRTFHSQFGAFELKKLIGKKYGSSVKTGTGEKFVVLRPDFNDLVAKRLRRKPQIIHKKDIGLIITYLGIGRESKVLEAGTGSAFLTVHLANIVKEVVTYEKRDAFYENAKKNIENLGLGNVKIFNDDILKCKEKDFDVIVLDLPGPAGMIKKLIKKLKTGGRVCIYSPDIENAVESKKMLETLNFKNVKFMECLIREYQTDKCVRPLTQMLGHTGYLIFGRII